MAKNREKQHVGKVHETSVQAPECQHEQGECPQEHGTGKPDFDEKDARIPPQRKAPGPDKPSGRSSGPPRRRPRDRSRPEAPEAKIDEDSPSESGNET